MREVAPAARAHSRRLFRAATLAEQRDGSGSLKFWAGSIALHGAFWHGGFGLVLAGPLVPLFTLLALRSVPRAGAIRAFLLVVLVGQIVLLAKHWRGDAWQTLSIPRGGSAA